MAGRLERMLVLAAFLLSLLILLGGAFHQVAAQEASSDPADSPVSYRGAPLVVPVYPKGVTREAAPEGADLRDSYIVLEDGSVLSMADWILGALKKDTNGAGMSDLENRLFLGKVARSLAGPDGSMANRGRGGGSAGQPADPGPAPVSLGPLLLGRNKVGPNPALVSGPSRGIYVLNDAVGTDRTDEISVGRLGLLPNAYDTAFANAIEDFKIQGTLKNMLRAAEKEAKKQGQKQE